MNASSTCRSDCCSSVDVLLEGVHNGIGFVQAYESIVAESAAVKKQGSGTDPVDPIVAKLIDKCFVTIHEPLLQVDTKLYILDLITETKADSCVPVQFELQKKISNEGIQINNDLVVIEFRKIQDHL